MEIILIRHGLPLREERNDASMADPPLAEIGLEQARRMANWLTAEEKSGANGENPQDQISQQKISHPISHIVSSPRARAMETAAPLAEKLNMEIEVIEEFAEIDRSSSMYIPVEEMRREEHPQLKKLMNGEWSAAGFMDPVEFQKEVMKAFQKFVESRDSGDKIALICHGGTINAIVSSVLRLKDFFFFEPGYTSITRIKTDMRVLKKEKKDKTQFRVFTLNEMGHLHATAKSLEALPKI